MENLDQTTNISFRIIYPAEFMFVAVDVSSPNRIVQVNLLATSLPAFALFVVKAKYKISRNITEYSFIHIRMQCAQEGSGYCKNSL